MNKLQKKAEDAKFVRRKSPLDGSVFLQALALNVFQFGVIVLDQLAKAAHRINPNVEVTGQAFKERFNAAAVEFLKACFVEALKTTAPQPAQVIPLLSAFSEVNLLDSSSVQLPESLKENYPGCGGVGSKAAAKVYDLGFFCAPFLAQIAKLGSFYLCRLAASQLRFFARNAAGELVPFDLDRFLRRAPRQLFEIEVVFGPLLARQVKRLSVLQVQCCSRRLPRVYPGLLHVPFTTGGGWHILRRSVFFSSRKTI